MLPGTSVPSPDQEGTAAHAQRSARMHAVSKALIALAFGASLLPATAEAAAIEEIVQVPVSVQTIFGPLRQNVVVTVFRDDRRQKSPYLILNHGRSGDPEKRAMFGRARYTQISHELVGLGFTVLVPTRIGYGVTGGPDVESPGSSCAVRNYAPGFDTAAAEVAAVLRHAQTLPHVDTSRGLVAGTSFGGMLSIRLAAASLPGLVGVVNFAGGMGGNPKRWPERPCASSQLDYLYRSYGATAKVPSLWLYSMNDRYWGPLLPHQWHADFVRAGGDAQFVQLPPFADDGHSSFKDNPRAWAAAFQQFVRRLRLIDQAAGAG